MQEKYSYMFLSVWIFIDKIELHLFCETEK